MASGRKDRVVISCVTFEVAKVVEPVEYYEATRVHLLSTSREGDVYRRFLDEVCRRISSYSKKTQIVKHITRFGEDGSYDFAVYDFSSVMREILCIIQEEIEVNGEGNVDIYVNISAGTSEYSAASLISSMMYIDSTTPFTVSTDRYTVDGELAEKIYFEEDGTPIGQARTCKPPRAISRYRVDMPDREKVLALDVMKTQIEMGDSCAATVMGILRDKGLFDEFSKLKHNSKPEQKDIMRYQRNYVDYWLDNNWIEKQSKRKYKVTDIGNEVLSVFGKSYSRGGK